MYPRTLIPDVDELKKVRIKSGFTADLSEQRFMGPRSAGRDNHPCEVTLLDSILYLGQPAVGLPPGPPERPAGLLSLSAPDSP